MSDPGTQTIDQGRAEAFTNRMLGLLNDGALALMTSIGHRTALFDTMAEMSAATSAEIAEEAGLDERYVREWLGAMVTGGIVEFSEQKGKYRLPAEHASVLTREGFPSNIACTAQWISVLGHVEDQIVECFSNGGGVPYSAYNRFHAVMAEESEQTVLSALIEEIVPLVPGLHVTLTEGIDVLDIGCGSGRALNLLAVRYPDSRFIGYDLSREAINLASEEAKRKELTNVHFEVRDVTSIDEPAAYDLVTAFDAIHDQAKPAKVLAEIATALRTDGTFLMQDIAASSHVAKNVDNPIGAFLYTISCMHCMTVSLAQEGDGLGAVWGEELALQMLTDAGFATVDIKRLPHDMINNYYIASKAR